MSRIKNLYDRVEDMGLVTEETASDVVECVPFDTLSAQVLVKVLGHEYDVDSPDYATADFGSLHVQAAETGASGNDISLEIVDDGVGEELAVSVDEESISVTLETSPEVAAFGEMELGDDDSISFVKTEAGALPNGSDIDLTVAAPTAIESDKVRFDFTLTSDPSFEILVTPNDGMLNPASTYSTGTLGFTAPVVLTASVKGDYNSRTFTSDVAAAAPNTDDEVLVEFTGGAITMTCTLTPNDGSNNGGTPVTLTTAEYAEMINTGAVVGKNVVITDVGNIRALQTASGGGSTPMAHGGEGDGETADFAGGALVPVNVTSAQLVELINTGAIVGVNILLNDTGNLRIKQTATGGSSQTLEHDGHGDGAEVEFDGGDDGGEILSTYQEVSDAINDDTAASLLVVTSVASGHESDIVAPAAEASLEGGLDGDFNESESTIHIPEVTFLTGQVASLDSTIGPPAPLADDTDYYVIRVDSETIRLAATEQDALDGVFIPFESEGDPGNVTTITSDTSTEASMQPQASNDGENWINIDAPYTGITSDSTFFISAGSPELLTFKYCRLLFDITSDAGAIEPIIAWLGRGIDG